MTLKNIVESTPSAGLKPESIAANSAYITNGAAFAWGAMTFNQSMMLVATVVCVTTFFVNLHFQKKRDQREQELHELRMQIPDRRE